MIAHCKGDINRTTQSGFEIKVSNATKDAIKKFLVSYMSKDNPPGIDFTMSVNCALETTAPGGLVSFQFLNMPDFYLEVAYNKKAKAQNTTLRGIERFIFWATEGYKPRGDKDIYYIHEAIIEEYSKPVKNPINGSEKMMRTSDPNMDTVTMARMINGALNWLSELQIPEEVLRVIGRPMKDLWHEWYSWRYENGNGDPLFNDEQEYSWTEYCKVHPVCELCGMPGAPGDPLERMHIISKGADLSIYEKPWNWLRAHHSHHHAQHADSGGWEAVLFEFPTIRGKVERAKRLWQKHNSEKLK